MGSVGLIAPPIWPTGVWALGPFAAMLLGVAILPNVAPTLWHRPWPRLGGIAAVALPCLGLQVHNTGHGGRHVLAHLAAEYIDFMALLTSLYVVTAGIHITCRARATPWCNVAWLAAGGMLAPLMGTTGASMLLLPPVLRVNAARPSAAHVMVFFIFIVGNCGGLLLPLGDPPLFLGYLRGVPFWWTLRLFWPWASVLVALLTIFWWLDTWHTGDAGDDEPRNSGTPLFAVEGRTHVGLLLALLTTVFASAILVWSTWMRASAMLALAAASYVTTPRARLEKNAFSWQPIVEVATVFFGVFATMMPASSYLQQAGPALPTSSPQSLFWATGLLSAVLDNAPTYVTFATLASVAAHTDPHHLGELAADAQGGASLRAISMGAVFFGALTYIGNGPNMLVRAVAQSRGVAMPSFAGYTLRAAVVLLPILGGIAHFFL